ncbi:MAG: hypothetical protein ACLR78_06675 [Roseburia sp.]
MILFYDFTVCGRDGLKVWKDLSHPELFGDRSRDRVGLHGQQSGRTDTDKLCAHSRGSLRSAVYRDMRCVLSLFLCRMIGAGDIKLMGLIVGFSGLWDGIFILGLGFVIAAVSAACRMTRQGTVWLRLERIARFAVESGINGKITEYQGYFEKESLMRLGPYLFAGYCLFLLIR